MCMKEWLKGRKGQGVKSVDSVSGMSSCESADIPIDNVFETLPVI